MRLGPLPPEQWDDDVDRALIGMLPAARRNPAGAGVALGTLVRHPKLTKAFLGFNIHLLFRSTLPERLRELVILRVAHRRGCTYEWTHHVIMGLEVGLTETDIEDLQHGTAAGALDRTVLAAVDELEEQSRISDPTWSALAEHLDERQRMDLVFMVGCYGTLAMAFNTFGIEDEQQTEQER
ncbi:MAG TPA: carboxymuconolactone decarboxylase family protein [Jiangellaceae bacterium]|nr:carboxymuconolactone decarboxylase family protein [Jiangellaceae bacterium]